MPKPAPKPQVAYLHDMLEAARLIRGYLKGVTFEEFWHNNENRDAVALRLSVLGESAHKIDKKKLKPPCPQFRSRVSLACVIGSPMTMVLSISRLSGP